MPGWLADTDLQSAVHDVLAKATSAVLAPHWASVITAANVFAFNAILESFYKRGFSPAVVAPPGYSMAPGSPAASGGWDRGPEFQRDLGIWYALTQLATQQKPGSITKDAIDRFDRRVELWGDDSKKIPAVAITVNGVWVDPNVKYGQPTTGPIHEGPMHVPAPWPGERDHRGPFV